MMEERRQGRKDAKQGSDLLKTGYCLSLWGALHSCFHFEASKLGFQNHQSGTVWRQGHGLTSWIRHLLFG